MGKPTIDISAAIRFIEQNHEPVPTAEIEGLVGESVVTVDEPDGKEILLYHGTLSKVYPTFHPNVIKTVYLKDKVRTRYSKGWLGWKQIECEKEENTTAIGNPAFVIGAVVCDGKYYSVHIGDVHSRDSCKYCEISNAHDWVEQYKRYGLKHEATRWMPGKEEAKKALRKYPKQLKEFFGADTVERLLNDLSKKR